MVNPKVASVFIPQVEDLVYNYLGISRKKSVTTAETSNGKISTDDLLPTDLEAVSPGSVKSNDDRPDAMDEDYTEDNKMDVDDIKEVKEEDKTVEKKEAEPEIIKEDIPLPDDGIIAIDSETSEEKSKLMPNEDIKLENIPPPDNSPPKFELDKIEQAITEVPHPDEIPLPNLPKDDKDTYFKPLPINSDDDSSSDSSLRRNMSPLTPIRNYNNENSCDAQQAFDNDSDSKSNDKKEPSSFRFAIEAKSPENSTDVKTEKKEDEQTNLSYQFNNQVNINTFTTPLYDDSSNSNNLQIDYESDGNSKTNNTAKEVEHNDQNSEDSRKDKKSDERKTSSSHKSSHRSRDSHRHSSSKDKRSDSKQSSSRDSSRHDKKSKDDHSKSKSSHREREKSRDRNDKKDSRDSSKHRSSSHKSSSHRDSKSHRSSSSSHRHSSDKSDKKSSDDKRTSSSHKDRSERSSDKSSKDKKDSKSSSHRSDKDRKSSSSSKSKHEDKDKKKEKKETDDHYSLSGRGNHGRRSTDRDSNDGSSSFKGSQNHSASKTTESKKESKESSSKSDNTSTSGESTSPCDKEAGITKASDTKTSQKPIRVENHLEVPIASPPRLPFVPDVTLKKPKFAANLEEAKRMMKMRKFLDEEQKRMNQEAALLLEFQANVRPSLSQVYSSIPGPELEFACISHPNDVNNIDEQVYTEQQVKVELVATDSSDVVQETAENNVKAEEEIKTEALPTNDDIIEEQDTKAIVDQHETYNENKPFSELIGEISEISKATEKKKDEAKGDNSFDEDKKRTEFFEITIITEELSETDEPIVQEAADTDIEEEREIPEVKTEITPEIATEETTQVAKEDNNQNTEEDNSLKYFAEHEKYDAEIKRHQYSNFLKTFTEKTASNKVFLLNCDTYEENILRDVYSALGEYEIVNYYKNGHLKLPKTAKNVVKDVNLASEITLPLDNNYEPKSPMSNTYQSKSPSPVFSPVKSECSFELSSDYDAKLEEMVNKTSRQEVMEIILGSVVETANPTIDYCTESSIESDLNLKRKLVEVESTVNNNRHVLAKMRKLSDSDQITSTTEGKCAFYISFCKCDYAHISFSIEITRNKIRQDKTLFLLHRPLLQRILYYNISKFCHFSLIKRNHAIEKLYDFYLNFW